MNLISGGDSTGGIEQPATKKLRLESPSLENELYKERPRNIEENNNGEQSLESESPPSFGCPNEKVSLKFETKDDHFCPKSHNNEDGNEREVESVEESVNVSQCVKKEIGHNPVYTNDCSFDGYGKEPVLENNSPSNKPPTPVNGNSKFGSEVNPTPQPFDFIRFMNNAKPLMSAMQTLPFVNNNKYNAVNDDLMNGHKKSDSVPIDLQNKSNSNSENCNNNFYNRNLLDNGNQRPFANFGGNLNAKMPFAFFNNLNNLARDLSSESSVNFAKNTPQTTPSAFGEAAESRIGANASDANSNNSAPSAPIFDLSIAISLIHQANSFFNNKNSNNNNNSIDIANRNSNNRHNHHHNSGKSSSKSGKGTPRSIDPREMKAAAASLLSKGLSAHSGANRSRHTTPSRTPCHASPAPSASSLATGSSIAIPGAVAVAASPAAILFSQDDWSWHRNPAASIRSGGTNKQTPVWKYFVYNKAENLSRCIVGTCTYTLKGPHTSTLACHLKKHPAQYAEFQKLKAVYTRDRNTGQMNGSGNSGSNGSTHNHNANISPNATPNGKPSLSPSFGSTSPSSCSFMESRTSSPKATTAMNLNMFDGLLNSAANLNATSGSSVQNLFFSKGTKHNEHVLRQRQPNSAENMLNLGTPFNFSAYAATFANSTTANTAAEANANKNGNGDNTKTEYGFEPPYSSIFGGALMNGGGAGIAAAMAAAAMNGKNAAFFQPKNTQPNSGYCETNALEDGEDIKKSPSKSASSMSEILAVLNRRAAAAAALAAASTSPTRGDGSCAIVCDAPTTTDPVTGPKPQSDCPTFECLLNSDFVDATIDRKPLPIDDGDLEEKEPQTSFDPSPCEQIPVCGAVDENILHASLNEQNSLSSPTLAEESPTNFVPNVEKSSTYDTPEAESCSLQKWPLDDARQRKLETKLALALTAMNFPLCAGSQVPEWRELLEEAEPQFRIPGSDPKDIQRLNELLNLKCREVINSIKSQLKFSSAISLIIQISDDDTFHDLNGNAKDGYKCSSSGVWLAVAATFCAPNARRPEVVLLSVRQSPKNDSNEHTVEFTKIIYNILDEYDLKLAQVSGVLLCGSAQNTADMLAANGWSPELRKRLISPLFGEILTSLEQIIESDDDVTQLKQTFLAAVEPFTQRAGSPQVEKLCSVSRIELRLSKPFFGFLGNSSRLQQIIDNFGESFLSNQQLEMIQTLSKLTSLIDLHKSITTNSDEQHLPTPFTIDHILKALADVLELLEHSTQLPKTLCVRLKSEIQAFVERVFNTPSTNAAFMHATALVPRFANRALNAFQRCQAKTSIQNLLHERVGQNSVLSLPDYTPKNVNQTLHNFVADKCLQPISSRGIPEDENRYEKEGENAEDVSSSILCSSLIEAANRRIRELETNTIPTSINQCVESLVDDYFDELTNLSHANESAREFWQRRFTSLNGTVYPASRAQAGLELSRMAIEVLSVPVLAEPFYNPHPTNFSKLRELSPKISPMQNINPSGELAMTTTDCEVWRAERNAILRANRCFKISRILD